MRFLAIRRTISTPTPYHVIAVLFLSVLLASLPLPIFPILYRFLACKYYFRTRPEVDDQDFTMNLPISHDPGNNLPIVCEIVEVERLTASLAAGIDTVTSICTILSVTFFSHLVKVWGRKRVILLSLLAYSFTPLLYIAAIWMSGRIGFAFVVSASLLDGLFSGQLFLLALQNYIIDTVEASSRAGYFAFASGVARVALAASSTLGGWSSSKTGKMKTPFWISAFGLLITFVLTLIFLPESLTPERRAAMSALYPENRESDPATKSTYNTLSKILRLFNMVENLKSLLPQTVENERTGVTEKDYRVFCCAIGCCLTDLLNFSGTLLLLSVTARMKLSPKEVGRYGHQYFDGVKPSMRHPPTEQTPLITEEASAADDDVILDNGELLQYQPKASEFDRVVAWVSYIFHAGDFFILAFCFNWPGILTAQALGSLSSGSNAAITRQNLKDEVDKLLSAVTMLRSIAFTVSPTIFGGVYALTVAKLTWVPWVLCGAMYLLAAVITILPKAPRSR
ncbi:hypothetical protein BT69DRAFT_1316309 [Atractiella rhizophila]|nr:hypothetical protein BT69DRAFT_1316309 [Atractiella rhizophila]